MTAAKKNAARLTCAALEDRMVPAALLAAPAAALLAPPADGPVAAVVRTAEAGPVAPHAGPAADAIWVGDAPHGAAGLGVSSFDPLSGARGKLVAGKDLKAGDVLLSTGTSTAAAVIMAGTGSIYTHAALYVGNGRVVEAVGKGVREVSLEDYLKDTGSAMVVRVPGLGDADREGIAAFARRQVGKAYNMEGAIASARPDALKWIGSQATERSSYYCSQLVTTAYKSVGKDLFHTIDQTPGDLAERATSNFLRSVKMEATGRLTTC